MSSTFDDSRPGTFRRAPSDPSESVRRASYRDGWPLLIVLAVAIAALVLLGNEWLAARELRQHVQAQRSAGLPVDDETLAAQFYAATSQERTAEWSELLFLAQRQWYRTHDLGLWDRTSSAWPFQWPDLRQPWPDAELHQKVLEEARPLIDRMEELSQHPEPTWQPVAFEGTGTLLPELQASASLHSLLGHEFMFAIRAGEPDRALRSLRIERAVTHVFDWRWCIPADLRGMASLTEQHHRIRQSLAVDPWTDAHLATITDLVGPALDVSDHWRSAVAGNQALVYEDLAIGSGDWWAYVEPPYGTQQAPLIVPATQKLQIIRTMEHDRSLADGGYEGLQNRVAKSRGISDASPTTLAWFADRRYHTNQWREYFPFYRDVMNRYAAACEGLENSRRMTVTALAIKRYQLREGDWPDALGELAEFGVATQDRTQLNGEPFTYKRHPDSDHVTLTNTESESYDNIVVIRSGRL